MACAGGGNGQRRHLATAAASGETLIALVDAVLEYARLEASTETLEPRNFRLDQLIETAAELMRPQALGKGLTFDLACDASVHASVHGDPVRLNRILLIVHGLETPETVTLPRRDGIGQYTLLWNSALDDVEVIDHAPGTTLTVAGTSLQLFRAH